MRTYARYARYGPGGTAPVTSVDELLQSAQNLQREKWDWALPEPFLFRTYASLNLNIEEALGWARSATGA